MVKEINHFYLKHSCLWENDFDPAGFAWVDFSDSSNSVISYLRKGFHSQMLCVHNFTPQFHEGYFIRLENVSAIQELLNTDAERFGGSDKVNKGVSIVRDSFGKAIGINITVAPLATQIYALSFVH